MTRLSCAVLTTGLILGLSASIGRAETLAEAIALAYQTNPTLQSQRAQLQGIDEGYVQARVGWGPTVQAQVTGAYTQTKLGKSEQRTARLSNPNPPDDTEQNSGAAELVISQPLYTGGKTTADVRSAEARIRAGREALRGAEGDVILAVIQAYSDVIRDQRSLDVRQTSLQVLVDQLKETEARQRAGEVTRTDVAQAQAQLAAERALYASAQGQLQISRTEYATVVGRNPGELAPEPDLPGIPSDVAQAFDIAEEINPELHQAKHNEEVSRAAVVSARATYRPTLSLRGTLGYTGALAPFDRRNYDRAVTGEAVFNAPLFTSGLDKSLIRQALDQNTSDRISIEAARRTVVQNLANAWNQMQTAKANVIAQDAQVKAAKVAFEGMHIEYRAGERSTLDVLVAEETLRDAELALISARRDDYLAGASVLRTMGRLEVRALMTGVAQYDAAKHFNEVKRAGALPWEGVIAHLDGFAEPDPDQRAIPAPKAGNNPEIVSTARPQADDLPLSTSVPIAPVPGTVSPVIPEALSNRSPK